MTWLRKQPILFATRSIVKGVCSMQEQIYDAAGASQAPREAGTTLPRVNT
ncbi:hypothetical protein NSND_60650 [Nitrospira sp. ND1]|nr:hypothetical protein NSND_60650 [Nitrospira sp. ND1]